MKIKKLILSVVLILVVTVFIGGKFVKEPDEDLHTLLIGQIKLEASGFPGESHVNGIHTGDIEIHLKNKLTGEIVILTSALGSGCFYMVNPETENYRIVKLYTLIHNPRYRQTLSMGIPTGGNISILNGKVNNLGHLVWKVDHKSESWDLSHNFHADVKAWFEKTYPGSAWNKKEWVDVTILSD
ncbi:MAG TPA: hypothetical protein VMZ05_03865 [Spirochaetota bacterium]|nr:hypothetical protein [Spirochaetota bacterium]